MRLEGFLQPDHRIEHHVLTACAVRRRRVPTRFDACRAVVQPPSETRVEGWIRHRPVDGPIPRSTGLSVHGVFSDDAEAMIIEKREPFVRLWPPRSTRTWPPAAALLNDAGLAAPALSLPANDKVSSCGYETGTSDRARAGTRVHWWSGETA